MHVRAIQMAQLVGVSGIRLHVGRWYATNNVYGVTNFAIDQPLVLVY